MLTAGYRRSVAAFGYSDPDSAETIALDVLIASQARIERLAMEHQDLPQAC